MGSLFHKNRLVTEDEIRAYNLGFPKKKGSNLIIFCDIVISIFAGVFAVINLSSEKYQNVFTNFKYFFLIWSLIKIIRLPWVHESVGLAQKGNELCKEKKEIMDLIDEINSCETSREQIKILKILQEKLLYRGKSIEEIKNFKKSSLIELKEIYGEKILIVFNSSISCMVTLLFSLTPNSSSLQILAFVICSSLNLLSVYSVYKSKKSVEELINQASEEEKEENYCLESKGLPLPSIESIQELIQKIQKDNKLIKSQDIYQ